MKDLKFLFKKQKFFIPVCNLLSCKLDNYTSTQVLRLVILYYYCIKKKENFNIFLVHFEKSKTISFASPIMENICVFRARSRFTVKLVCCISSGLAFSFCCLIKSIQIRT